MKVIQLSRLEELHFARKRRQLSRSALDQLFAKYPMRYEVGDNERRDRRFWKYIANKRNKVKTISKRTRSK